MRNSVRLSGSEEFVEKAGDTIVSLLVANYDVTDSGVKKSSNPKYKGNYIRYISVNLKS